MPLRMKSARKIAPNTFSGDSIDWQFSGQGPAFFESADDDPVGHNTSFV